MFLFYSLLAKDRPAAFVAPSGHPLILPPVLPRNCPREIPGSRLRRQTAINQVTSPTCRQDGPRLWGGSRAQPQRVERVPSCEFIRNPSHFVLRPARFLLYCIRTIAKPLPVDAPEHNLEPLPYHIELRDYLKSAERELWKWFASERAQAD